MNFFENTVGGKKGLNKIWSKTTLITSGVGGAGVDSLPRKLGTFFLRSLTLSVPILEISNQMEQNGELNVKK